MIVLSIKPVLLFWSFVVPAWIVYRLVTAMKNKRKVKAGRIKHELLLFIFVIYGTAVLAITIAPGSMYGFNQPQGPKVNVIPFLNTYHNFKDTLADPSGESTIDSLENIIGNFFLFTPLGILLPLIFSRINSFKQMAVIFLITAISIEMIQLVLRRFGTYRTADIDDVILNTTGGILGWLIYAHIFKSNRKIDFPITNNELHQ